MFLKEFTFFSFSLIGRIPFGCDWEKNQTCSSIFSVDDKNWYQFDIYEVNKFFLM